LINRYDFFLTTARKDKVLSLYDPNHILFTATELFVYVTRSKYY